jgi:hypothetical protein
MRILLPRGGHRTLFLHCRPDRNQVPPPLLTVVANGVLCGSVRLERAMTMHRIDLPPGAVKPGMNVVDIVLEENREQGGATGRTLLIRRLAIARRADAVFDDIHSTRPLRWFREEGSVVITQPGRLLVFFDVASPASSLEFHYRLRRRTEGVAFDVGVGRWYAELDTIDVVNRKRLTVAGKRTKRFRHAFGNHTGPVVVTVDVDDVGAGAGLEIVDPRVVAGR